MLSIDEAIRVAADAGLVDPATARASALGGGVSNDTILVEDDSRRCVVKRALGRLRTEKDWRSDPGRALAEAEVLGRVADLTPEHVPRVLAVDPDSATIAIEAAPVGWRDWKADLLDGTVRPAVGATLGRVLATWHRRTVDASWLSALDGMDRMESLRLVPFHGTIADAHPDLAGRVRSLAEALRTTRRSLVHGDFSPKNVLVGDEGLWVIDFEVAHRGHPVFDVTFLEGHLRLKAAADATSHGLLAETARRFLEGYRESAGAGAADLVGERGPHLGCLLLARVDGTSPVEYLDRRAAERVRALGRALVMGAVDADTAWDEEPLP